MLCRIRLGGPAMGACGRFEKLRRTDLRPEGHGYLGNEGGSNLKMAENTPDPPLHFANLVGAYADTIRTSDFKANLVVLFVAIMMGPIVAYRDHYPFFLPLPVVLSPFLVASA